MARPPEGPDIAGANASEASTQVAAGDPLAAAHQQMLADDRLQLQFAQFEPPDPPQWLTPLSDFIRAIAPILQYVFWAGVIIIVALVLWVLVNEIIRRMPARAKAVKAAEPEKPVYKPTAARARALLEEADRLAAEGRYGEAARVLLHRSIEDFEQVFQMAIGPALTSREVARLEQLSPQGRSVFTGIAQAVETALFAEQPLARERYMQCRDAYASFALQGGRR
ncbi:DUF4129 domain-containing protein [Terricaulis sp.]|uniref:DUF4129 domain-containing protein n=1 Tax=Terricaulis sp. TaxID=2768686 RepID=UPI00378474D7